MIELSLGDYGNSIDVLIKLVNEKNLINQNITGNNLMINLVHLDYFITYQKQ